MKKSILNIISLMCCLTIMLTATSCGNNAKKEEIVVDGIIPVSYTHLRAPRDRSLSRMPSSA